MKSTQLVDLKTITLLTLTGVQLSFSLYFLFNFSVLAFLCLLNTLLLVLVLFFFLLDSDFFVYLILAELVWVLCFCVSAVCGLYVDSFYLLATTMIILVLAGAEFSLGLLIFYFY